MTAELESVGALATAALVASELEGEAGKAPAPAAAAAAAAPVAPAAPAHSHAKCANCGTDLVGAYCHSCGQTGHIHRSLLHIGEELLHGILHFDTRSWRTLPLLAVRPGLLTRRYIDGQRSRYVSPLALFLFSVFLMFFIYSFVGGGSGPDDPAAAAQKTKEAHEQLSEVVEDERQKVADLTAEVAAATTPEQRSTAAARLTAAENELKGTTAALDALTAAASAATRATKGKVSGSISIEPDAANGDDAKYPSVTKVIRHAVDNQELTFYKIKNSAYKFAFMLVPISLPFLWLLFFWKRGIKFYDHAIFMLYSLSFMSLWAALMAVFSFSSYTSWLIFPALLYVPVHIFLHVKETYALSGWGATWRTFALMFEGTFIFLLFVLMILAISLH